VLCILFQRASAASAGQKYLDALRGIEAGIVPDSFMQEMQLVVSSSEGTPKVVESMRGMRSKFNKTKNDIKAGFKTTNMKINYLVVDIEVKDTLQSDAKKEADDADRHWVKCVGELQSDRSVYDKAMSDLEEYKKEEETLCLVASQLSVVHASIPPQSMECNFDNGNSCDAAYKELDRVYSKPVTTAVGAIKNHIETYRKAKERCDIAVKTRESGEQTVSDAKEAWEVKTKACATKKTESINKMCKFQTAYNAKCLSIGEYSSTVQRANSTNHPESSRDRKQEWKATMVSDCLLRELLLNGKVDADACLAEVDYSSQVGKLNFQTKKVDSLKSVCDNTASIAFTYSGESWTIADPVTDQESYAKQEGVTIKFSSLGCTAA